jgi:hypothetical protein
MSNEDKVYVPVEVSFSKDGEAKPLSITWENGHVYEIDRILDVRQAAARKVGGGGIRYTVKINFKTTYLYFEQSSSTAIGAPIGRWFVEKA